MIARQDGMARDDALVSRRAAGRIAAFLFAVLAGLGNLLSVFLPLYPAASRPLLALACAVFIAIGLVFWVLPWDRWPRRASLWVVPLAFACVTWVNCVIPINPYRYGIYLIAVFAWIGIAHRRGASLAFLPVLLVVYLLPLKVTGLLTPASGLSVLYVALFCVLLGEMLAWIASRLAATQRALRLSEERYRALSEHATDLIAVVDSDGRHIYASPSYQTVLGYDPANVVGTPVVDYLDAEGHALFRRHWTDWQQPGAGPTRLEMRARHADGSWRWLEAIIQPVLDDPAIGGIMAIARDITARKQAEQQLRQSEEQYRLIVETAQEGVLVLGPDACLTYVNQRLAEMLGYTVAEMTGESLFAFMDEEQAALTRLEFARRRDRLDETRRFDSRLRHKDGSWIWVHASTVALTDEAGQFAGEFGMLTDITERKQAEDELRYQALHDALTGLANRTLLRDHLEQALPRAELAGSGLALLLLDMDRFNEVNDTFGHSHGDLVLQEVARRLSATSCASDLVARLGGDEFAVVRAGDDAAGALAAAEALSHVFADSFEVDGYVLHLTASIGIALYPEHGADAATLLRCADVAMYAAKQDGRTAAVYAPERDPHSAERIMLIAELRQAIAQGGLVLHYQPKVAVATDEICGAEALVRWPHPERGLIPPDQFIGLAEQTGQIDALTRWVLGEAIRQAHVWRTQGRPISIAVNLSTANLLAPQLYTVVADLLATYDMPPSLLRLEVTESTLMADMNRALDVLTNLAALGVGISIDDYGTGYSSLAYLKRLPVDEIKIDRSFVQHMAEDESDASIVASTVGLAHSLGRRVVAEGVESEHALGLLREMRCDVVQGYYLSRPLPPEGFEQWLRGRADVAAGNPSAA